MERQIDEPEFVIFLGGSCSLWFGLAWLVADLLAAPASRSVDPQPFLGALVGLGFASWFWVGPRLSYEERARAAVFLLVISVVATAWPAVCLWLGLRPSTKLYPHPTHKLLVAWVLSSGAVALVAGASLARNVLARRRDLAA